MTTSIASVVVESTPMSRWLADAVGRSTLPDLAGRVVASKRSAASAGRAAGASATSVDPELRRRG